MRLRLRVAPRGPFSVWSVVPMAILSGVLFTSLFLLGSFHAHQVRNALDHAAHRSVVGDDIAAPHLAEPQSPHRPLLLLGTIDAASDQGDFQFLGHGYVVISS